LTNGKHVGHGKDDIAYHFEWGFRTEALRWRDGRALGVNFHPVASEFRSWLLREGKFSVFTEEHRQAPDAYSNPYTYHCSLLATILSETINDSHAAATSSAPLDAMDAEVQRIRIYNEQVLYIARLCEALIKQLLYCTQIGKRYYENASLGRLLSAECRGCKGSGAQRHNLSLLGSLAHRYGLCLPFEHCLFEHLKIVARRRNVEAAHSEAPLFTVRSASASRKQLMVESIEAGEEFVHMLQHISELENHMMRELEAVALSTLITRPRGKTSIQSIGAVQQASAPLSGA
jgi:hypothetical protein